MNKCEIVKISPGYRMEKSGMYVCIVCNIYERNQQDRNEGMIIYYLITLATRLAAFFSWPPIFERFVDRPFQPGQF